jgi:sarcosine oxidase
METLHVRNVVLGAGAMGSAAAYHLARRGEPVLVIEQFRLGHDRGSSHGVARITRHSYADVRYARLMPEAFRVWRQLEADAGMSLYVRTGGVSFSPPEVDYVAQVAASLADIGVPHRRMTGAMLRRAFPAFGSPDDTDVVFEPDAGMLAADRAVAVMAGLARELGGENTRILDETPVRRVDLDADLPTLLTDTYRITADHLIVAAGAWVGKLLPSMASTSRPTYQQVLYFRPTEVSTFAIGRFPIFISKGPDPWDAYYGMPPFLGCGVKAARHGGPEVDPDAVERVVSEEYCSIVRGFLRTHIPALAEAPIDRTETCLYTEAPNDDFRVGALPGRPAVFLASPCSGHGFKFSCLVGRVLAELAVEGRSGLDVNFWRIEDPS